MALDPRHCLARLSNIRLQPTALGAPRLKRRVRRRRDIRTVEGMIMAMRTTAPASVEEYIAASPSAVRPILKEIRRTISTAAPGAEELISYRMPAFRLHGILLYFAAFKNHIGLYPPVSGDARLAKALQPYAGPKGNLKFPLDRPIPYALIKRIVLLRVRQNLSRAHPSETKGREVRRTPPHNGCSGRRRRAAADAVR